MKMFPNVAVILLISCHWAFSGRVPSSRPHPPSSRPRPPSSTLYITCDNAVTGLYLDGRQVPVSSASNWPVAGQVRVPGGTRVVAVQCYDYGVIEGVLMSSSTGLVSDASWRCTHTLETGWTAPDFDDSHWPHARVRGNQGSRPWNRVVPNIARNAKWIWSPVLKPQVFCRVPYGKGDLPVPGPNMYVTCDNAVTGLYLDGKVTSVASASDWTVAGGVSVPRCTRVVAVQCYDAGVIEGVLISSSNGLVTDATWKCTHKQETGWSSPDFDDSHWPNARVRGNQGSSPWNRVVPNIATSAKWIWSPTLTPQVFCRAPYANVKRKSTSMYITCDNAVANLYLDGEQTPVSAASNWPIAGHVTVPDCTRVVAVQCLDYGVIEGVLMSSSTGLVSDATWKCTHKLETGWSSPDFDDSHWPNARVRGSQGSSPWNRVVPNIARNAKWIWSPVLRPQVFCRVSYTK